MEKDVIGFETRKTRKKQLQRSHDKEMVVNKTNEFKFLKTTRLYQWKSYHKIRSKYLTHRRVSRDINDWSPSST